MQSAPMGVSGQLQTKRNVSASSRPRLRRRRGDEALTRSAPAEGGSRPMTRGPLQRRPVQRKARLKPMLPSIVIRS